jgi:hypothetical protein
MARNNNSFRRATDLGTFSSSQVLRLPQDTIGATDKADVFKFTITPTLAFKASASFNAKGGGLSVSTFFINPLTNQRTPAAAPFALRAGKSSTTFDFPATNAPITFFVKFDKPTKDVKYRLTLSPVS